MLEVATGLQIPQGGQGEVTEGKVNCPVVNVRSQSYAEWLIRLPIKLYGWGFRKLEETCGPAYLGTLETAIPFMAANSKICEDLGGIWGGEECWGQD